MNATTIDVLLKVLLIILGAIVGAALTAYVNKRKLDNIMPLVLGQLDRVASRCANAFTYHEAEVAGRDLQQFFDFASKVVAEEIHSAAWIEGAKIINEVQIKVAAVTAGGEFHAFSTTADLRKVSQKLVGWVRSRVGK